MPVSCEQCGSDDLELARELPDTRREIRCVACGHSWFRGTAVLPSPPPDRTPTTSARRRGEGSDKSRRRKTLPGGLDQLRRFIEWLEDHEELAGARIVLRRHHNVDGQNLTGHVKQSFYGSLAFLKENPDLISGLVQALARLGGEAIYEPPNQIVNRWIDFLDENLEEHTDFYSFRTLVGILPPALGGDRQHGGGGVSTLKRMLPLVAAYLDERNR